MKQYIKYALVGVAGYLIGFYEMKYKVVKIIAESYCEERSAEKKEEES